MPIITISKGIFSGGFAIAVKLAERLGYQCAGREELYQSIKRYRLPDEVLQSIYADNPAVMSSPGTRIAVLNIFRAALLRHAQNGNLVYHGAVGHLLLSGISNILRVRINASMDLRIHTAMSSRGINHDQATALIKKDDQECERSARNLYDVDWRDPFLYDIVLNLNNVSINHAVELLTHMSRFDSFHPSPSSRREYEDLFLGCLVWAELINSPEISGADVMVTANGGKVTVHGHVRSEEIAATVSAVAGKIEGVDSVTCNLDVETMKFG